MAGSTIMRGTVARAVQTAIRFRPCRFWVDHTEIIIRSGGQQGEAETFGPYRGLLAAPGSTRIPFMSITPVNGNAGDMTVLPRWGLLTSPNAKVSFGGKADDYVRVDGFGRFKVTAVRPVGDIVPPVGLVIAMDQQT